MELKELVNKIEAGSWPERVAAVRSVPNEFPGREVSGVYAEVARSVYVPNLAPSRARIVIFQDTLERAFGSDPDLLARQVERTLRHGVAHHLGYNEPGVAALGL